MNNIRLGKCALTGVALFMVLLLLSGCTNRTLPAEVEYAKRFCAEQGSEVYSYEHFTGNRVYCANGAYSDLSRAGTKLANILQAERMGAERE